MTAGAVAGSTAMTAACIAAGFSSVSAPTGIATSAGAIATAATTVVTATSAGASTAMVAAPAVSPAAPATTTSITVGQRGLGVQRLLIKQRQWRGGQCRASEQCKYKKMEGAKLHHGAGS
jgi:hypothetical protein